MKFMTVQSGNLISHLLILVIVVLSFITSAFGQNIPRFQRTYGNAFGNEAGTVIVTEEGQMFIGGWYDVSALFTAEFYGLHVASDGDTIWARTFGEKIDTNANGRNGSGNEGYCAIQTMDGGFLIVGEVHGFGAGTSDVYAIKVSESGAYEWSRTYGGEEPDYGEFVVQLSDGGYAIAGFTESLQTGIRDMYLLRIDNTGDLLWNKTFGGTSIDAASELRSTVDGGFILVGYTFTYGEGGSDVYVIKTDSTGDIDWQRAYGDSDNDYGYSIQTTFDDGYIVAGATESFNGSEEALLIKLNGQGEVMWSKAYGGLQRETANSVTQTADSGFVACGYTTSYGAGLEDVLAIRTNSTGDTLWTKCYGGDETDIGWSVTEFPSGRLAMAGNTYSFGAGNADVYLISTDSEGESSCHEKGTQLNVTEVQLVSSNVNSNLGSGGKVSQPQTISGHTATEVLAPCDIDVSTHALNEIHLLKISPNPVKGSTMIEWDSNLGNGQYKLWTSNGQLLFDKRVNTSPISLELAELPRGVYILELVFEQESIRKKIVKSEF